MSGRAIVRTKLGSNSLKFRTLGLGELLESGIAIPGLAYTQDAFCLCLVNTDCLRPIPERSVNLTLNQLHLCTADACPQTIRIDLQFLVELVCSLLDPSCSQ